jgi:hypothetical protein
VLTISATAFVDGQKYNNTVAFINALDAGCKSYKNDFGKFPSSNDAANNISGSQCLHFYLGKKWPKIVAEVRKEFGPYVEFKGWNLKGNPENTEPNPARTLIDAWGNDIEYKEPGAKNPNGVDIMTFRGNPADESQWIYNK